MPRWYLTFFSLDFLFSFATAVCPRISYNLRASRDKELSDMQRAHGVAKLMGNSVKVSKQHYKMINLESFDSLKASRHVNGTQPTRNPSETNDNGGKQFTLAQEKTEGCGKPRRFASSSSTPGSCRTIPKSLTNTAPNSTGRLPRHNTDTQLNELIECWGVLDDKARVDLLSYAAGLTSPLQLIAGFHQQSKEEG
jgi:hypothetical protein